MPVNFKNLPTAQTGDHEKTFTYLQDQVRSLIGPLEACNIQVGMTRTLIERNGVQITLPFGIPHVKNGAPKLQEARQSLLAMVPGGAIPMHDPYASVPIPAAPVGYSDMTDQQWVEHTAQKLFPGTIHLYQSEELYQPVLGTSGGSIYKTCFIGPELKVAARIKGGKVSFRATTNNDECPTGQIKAVFQRLGMTTEHANRLTCHASMGGNYDEQYAHEYRALFGAFYAALKPWITSNFPAIGKLAQGVK